MKNKFLYLLMPSLLPGMLQGGEAARVAGVATPTFDQLSPIIHASSNGASVGRLHDALQKLYRSTSSGSSSVDSSSSAFDLLGKKRVRSLSSLSQERFLTSRDLSDMSDEVSVGSFSDSDAEGLVNGAIPLDLDEVLSLKTNGCDLTGDENIKYELQGWAPPYSDFSKKRDEIKSQKLANAKDLLEKAKANLRNSVPLTTLITHLRNNPNLTKWHDENYCTLANHLVEMVCDEKTQRVDCAFLEQILKRTRSAKANSANPVFRRIHAVAAHIKEETEPKKCEICHSLIRGNCEYCPALSFTWQKDSIIERANEIFFETPDQVLSKRKCEAATKLATAIEHNQVAKVDQLMAANPKVPFYCDDKRYFSIQNAAKFNRPDLIAKFEAAGVDKDQSYDGMMTPLQLAVVNGKLEAVKKLLELGASPNRAIYRGNEIDRPTPTAYMTASTLASVLAKGHQPNANKICLALQQRQ